MDHNKVLAACKRAGVGSTGGGGYSNLQLIHKHTVAADISNVKYRVSYGYIPDNLNEMVRKETTYEHCFHWGAKLKTQPDMSEAVILTVTIMDGDMVYGQPTKQRCSYDIIIDMNKPGHKHLFDQMIAPCLVKVLEINAIYEQTRREEARAKIETDLIYQEYFS